MIGEMTWRKVGSVNSECLAQHSREAGAYRTHYAFEGEAAWLDMAGGLAVVAALALAAVAFMSF